MCDMVFVSHRFGSLGGFPVALDEAGGVRRKEGLREDALVRLVFPVDLSPDKEANSGSELIPDSSTNHLIDSVFWHAATLFTAPS